MKAIMFGVFAMITNLCLANTVAFVAPNEGFRSNVYTCIAGKKTIGYGFTSESIVSKGKITKAEADQILGNYCVAIGNKIDKLVTVELTDNQKTVLIDFCYQYGSSAFASSTLLKKINAGAPATEIHTEIKKWNKIKSNGKYVISKGLNNRNDRRVALWGV